MALLASSAWILAHATAGVEEIYYRENPAGRSGQHGSTPAMTLYRKDVESQRAFPEDWPNAALKELLTAGYIMRIDKDGTDPPERYAYTEAGREAAPGFREALEEHQRMPR